AHTAPTALYTLSLHDALPIYAKNSLNRPIPLPDRQPGNPQQVLDGSGGDSNGGGGKQPTKPSTPNPSASQGGAEAGAGTGGAARSEEHTSELQSRENLVCRLL